MPESKGRKKDVYTPPPTHKGERKVARIGSPSWLAPTMVTLFVVGLAYIVVFYVAGSQVPIMRDLSAIVNVAIGFALIMGGFFLATKWK